MARFLLNLSHSKLLWTRFTVGAEVKWENGEPLLETGPWPDEDRRGVIWFDEIDWKESKARMVGIRGGIASSLRQVLDSNNGIEQDLGSERRRTEQSSRSHRTNRLTLPSAS